MRNFFCTLFSRFFSHWISTANNEPKKFILKLNFLRILSFSIKTNRYEFLEKIQPGVIYSNPYDEWAFPSTNDWKSWKTKSEEIRKLASCKFEKFHLLQDTRLRKFYRYSWFVTLLELNLCQEINLRLLLSETLVSWEKLKDIGINF